MQVGHLHLATRFDTLRVGWLAFALGGWLASTTMEAEISAQQAPLSINGSHGGLVWILNGYCAL